MSFEVENDLHKAETKSEPFAIQSDVLIWTATDYSKFKLNEFNREPSHYKRVLDSIQRNDHTKYQPILVDREMNIVDGQNRFLACKELGLPIHFIVSKDIHIFAAADINQASKNWSTLDYVQHYSKRGKESYTKILDLCAKYNQRISIIIQFGKLSEGAKSHTENVKRGNFQFREDIDVEDFFEHVSVFNNYYDFSKNDRFVRALLRLYLHEDYDKNRMVNKLRKASGIVNEQPKIELIVEELLKVYNYRARKVLTL